MFHFTVIDDCSKDLLTRRFVGGLGSGSYMRGVLAVLAVTEWNVVPTGGLIPILVDSRTIETGFRLWNMKLRIARYFGNASLSTSFKQKRAIQISAEIWYVSSSEM